MLLLTLPLAVRPSRRRRCPVLEVFRVVVEEEVGEGEEEVVVVVGERGAGVAHTLAGVCVACFCMVFKVGDVMVSIPVYICR